MQLELGTQIVVCFSIPKRAQVEPKLRKYKSKLKNRHAKLKPSEISENLTYEISPYNINVDDDDKWKLEEVCNLPNRCRTSNEKMQFI